MQLLGVSWDHQKTERKRNIGKKGVKEKGKDRKSKRTQNRGTCIKSNLFLLRPCSEKGPNLNQFRNPEKDQTSQETLVHIRLKAPNANHKMDFFLSHRT